jgi:hypothetical protein
MKSKRAEEFINNRSEVVDGQWRMVDASTARRAVELAEQDAEEKIEALKARAVEAHRKCCFFRNDSTNECANTATQCGEHSCFYMDVFIQKLNEQ